ncbi:Imm21 family immunity protein [Streptomyces cellulosae]|uniref:Imm21 family immunity protein n=1 Tax=Streptomyces cellulosae TaxID=1968 RepID=A0ABW6JAJ5_STRCE
MGRVSRWPSDCHGEALRNLWGGYANFDYDNACKVDGYAGLVTFGEPSAPVTGLIINDIPAPTAFMEKYRFIVQCISSSSDARFVETVREGIGSVGMWDERPIVRERPARDCPLQTNPRFFRGPQHRWSGTCRRDVMMLTLRRKM